MAGVVVACPTLLVLAIPKGAFDEDGVGMSPNVQPLDLPDLLHGAVVTIAAMTLLGAAVTLLSPDGRRASAGTDVGAAAALTVAGLYVAFTYRVATAAVSGANIGAGLLFLLGAGLVPALVVVAVLLVRSGRDRQP